MKKEKFIFKAILVTASLIAFFSAIFVPKLLLDKKSERSLSQIIEVPDSYYLTSQTATARSASSKLSALDKIQLICGVWDSSMTQCDVTEGFLTMDEAVSLARAQMELYYQAGLYPVSLYSAYDNWYSFECNLYKYTDTSFKTYTAYLWEITFTKFDTSTYHTLLMSESGTILAADTNMTFNNPKNIYENAFKTNCAVMIGDTHTYLGTSTKKSTLPYIPYTQLNLSSPTVLNTYSIQLRTTSTEFNDFSIYQYKKPQGYGFGIVAE